MILLSGEGGAGKGGGGGGGGGCGHEESARGSI
jgi:hypothetical protein